MTTEELLKQLHVPRAPADHHHSRPGWWQTDCPYCSPQSQRFRLGINLRGGFASCWLCRAVPLTPTLVRLTGREASEVRRLTAELDRDRGQPLDRRVLTGELKLPQNRGPLKKIHRRFLRGRGFDPKEVANDWGVQGIGPLGGRYSWRLFIPVHLGTQVVSWTTRAVTEGAPRRYDAAPEDSESYPAKRLLYGEHKCGHAVMVVEGPLDVWAVGAGSVCTMGAAVGREQLLRLSKFPVRYICLDAEADAQRVARWLVRELSAFDGETYNIILETGKDPSRVKPRELRELRAMLAV